MNQAALDSGMKHIKNSVEQTVAKALKAGTITEEQAKKQKGVLNNITGKLL
jgi:hypothetical protein